MMLQDISPHKLRNQFSERTEPKSDDPVFCFRGSKLLIKENAGHSFEKKAGLAFEGGRVSMPETGLEWKDEKQFYIERGRFLRLPEVGELPFLAGEKAVDGLPTVPSTVFLRRSQPTSFPTGTGTTASAEPAAHPLSILTQSGPSAALHAAGPSIPASFRQSSSVF